ncbi:MAG TPA: hypothetical protein VFU21_12285, partial [Kofleriaceae bacterium]|nr:hypothetical protein [Kofleriaceae bacterium]
SPDVRRGCLPLAPQRYQIRVTVDEETHAALCQLQDLLSHQIPDRDPAAIISRALAHELERTLARRTRATTRPRRAMATAPAEAAPDRAPARRTRHVPAAACREVWQRDGGRCAFVDPKGRRCSSTRFLELHHVNNWARGAAHDPAEMELRCRAHNQYQAELDYGAAFMAAKRRAARSSAGESGAVYGSAPARSAGRRKRCEQAGAPAADSLGAHRATSSGRGAGARHVPWTQPPSTQRPPPPNTGMQAGPASAGTANTPAAKKGRLTAMGP